MVSQKNSLEKFYDYRKGHAEKLMKLPKIIRYPLAVLLLLFGLINLPNPFLNGIFFMLLGGKLISEDVYEKIFKKTIKKTVKKNNKKNLARCARGEGRGQ